MAKLNKEIILNRFKDIHSGLYDYEDFEYSNREQKIKIFCNLHGVFEQRIKKHLEGQGCKKCAGVKSASKWNKPTGYRDRHGVQVQYQEYTVWRAMIQRSKPKYWEDRPHYSGTTVSDTFKSWDSYKDWYDAQFNSSFTDDDGKPFELDKDLLSNGGRHYSEDTCCFLPRCINIGLRNKSIDLWKLVDYYKESLDEKAYKVLLAKSKEFKEKG